MINEDKREIIKREKGKGREEKEGGKGYEVQDEGTKRNRK